MTGRDGFPAEAAPAAAASRPRTQWTDGLLFGAAGVIGFSGTAPATRVAAPVFGPVMLTFARIVIAALLAVAALAASLRSPPARGGDSAGHVSAQVTQPVPMPDLPHR